MSTIIFEPEDLDLIRMAKESFADDFHYLLKVVEAAKSRNTETKKGGKK